MIANGPYLKDWYPGLGEVSVLRSFPRPIFQFVQDAAEEDPNFLEEYLVPLLGEPDALDRITCDLSDAIMDLENGGLGELGFLGKSLLKRAASAVKRVHKAVAQKIMPKAVLKVEEKINKVAKNVGKKYGSTLISAAGAILAPFTGGASLAAAAVLVAANNAYQKKRQADAAKKMSAANAAQLQAEAAAANAATERQVNDFYSQNQAWFEQYGITPAKWARMTLQQKIDTINAGANGTLKPNAPPPPAMPGGGFDAPSPSGAGSPGMPSYPSGGGGGGGDSGLFPGGTGPSGATSPYQPGGPSGQPQAAQAGMLDGGGGMLLPMLAVGAAVMLSSGKKGGGSRRKRNPSRRRRW